MKPKYSFNSKAFLLGLGFIIAGAALAYWQYQQWFNPEVIGGVGVRKFSLGGILLALGFIIGGVAALITAFRGGAEASLVFLPKEKFADLKKAIETQEAKDFEKLLEGKTMTSDESEYAALTIERFKDQLGIATVQASRRILHSTGQFYDSKDVSPSVPVEGAVLDILQKIEIKYGSQKGY